MKYLPYVLLLIFFCECSQKCEKNTNKLNIEDKVRTKAQAMKVISTVPEKNDRTEKEIEESDSVYFDKYLMSIKDSIVSLCCQDELYNPFGELNKSKVKSYLKDYSYSKESESNKDIFRNDSNLVSIVTYKAEYAEDVYEVFLGKGILYDKSLELNNGIKIGMSKKTFMDKFFHFPDSVINNLNQVSACEDERGDSFTKYKFKDNQLIYIKFGEWNEFD
ncbi:hypothetical protein [Marinifilum sp. D737]|uniref:hypothetical protein n=1 Tax=Marinifilum sp. D737 TaxID=2969628 RepID=UPI0022726FFA|nr:hypothetical protein [Marinifilum sp. D737]MCY1635497.1 hypothetical protein [Marinifilum sp. D737]